MKMSTRAIATAGILAALAIILKTYLSFTTAEYRFTFFDIPLMISGIAFGPFVGGVAGFVTDFVYATQSPFGFSFNLMTVSSILWGAVPGLLLLVLRRVNIKTLIVIVLITSVLCFTLNSIQLYIWFGEGMFANLLPRIITMVVKWPIEVYMLKVVYERVLKPYNFALER